MENLDNNAVESTAVENTEVVDGGNLPSALDEANDTLSKYKLEQETLDKYIKSGKLFGKYDSIQTMLESHQALEAKHSNLVRDMKSGKYQEVNQAEVIQAKQQETVKSLIPEFMEAGMQLTPEIEAKATEAGIDIRDLKLGAIEFREAITKAHEVVGGSEEYNAMIEWGKANLSESQKLAFDTGVNSAMSEYAIKGLYADYRNAIASGEPSVRLRGDSSSGVGIRPYANQAEMLKDRAYVNGAGRNDNAARELHNRRMNITSDDVVYGRSR